MAGIDPVDLRQLESEVRALCDRKNYDGAATLAIRELGGEVFGFLIAVQRDEAMADEAFSAFAEGLWRGLPTFAWSSTLRTWAYAIARNVLRMQRRGDKRREKRTVLAGSSAFDEVAAAVRTSTLTFLRTEKRSRLEKLRAALTPEERTLLILRVDRGLGWNELARVLTDDAATWEERAITREAAKLRKRFQLLKDRLREMARQEGLTEKS
jgi:RNA polymerase sigma-70 factor, ECF subfamily